MSLSIHPLACSVRIIGVLLTLALLAGCSAVRIGYNNAPSFVYWWLDGFADFDEAQTQRVRTELGALHGWHRSAELPAYAELLGRMQQQASGPASPQQVCQLAGQIRQRVLRLGEQAAPGMAALVPMLRGEQLGHLAQQFDKRNRQWREEWLDVSPAELAEFRLKKAVERAENFYGRLEEAQRELLRRRMASSAFDARLAWRERLRRQQDMLQVLREHGTGARPAHLQAEMQALIRRSLESPDPGYRAQFERLMEESCVTIAALHNSASAAQRQHLLQTLRDYEADARALAAQK